MLVRCPGRRFNAGDLFGLLVIRPLLELYPNSTALDAVFLCEKEVLASDSIAADCNWAALSRMKS
jgi:hypothetical protein